MKRSAAIVFVVGALLLLRRAGSPGRAVPDRDRHRRAGRPAGIRARPGPGTLIRYGDDANNCSAVRLQFDAGRGTLLRLSQINVCRRR